jgi:hypothetical protein
MKLIYKSLKKFKHNIVILNNKTNILFQKTEVPDVVSNVF